MYASSRSLPSSWVFGSVALRARNASNISGLWAMARKTFGTTPSFFSMLSKTGLTFSAASWSEI